MQMFSAAQWGQLLALALLSTLTLAQDAQVTCGSTIKLMHIATRFRLHSHEVAYSRGSQQQSVTCYPTGDDANSLWVVYGTVDKPCVPGDTVKKNQAIRMQHVGTRKWLHSHRFQSPLSGNWEVSAFGGEFESDGGDVWLAEWDTNAKIWRQDTKVRFKHRDTGVYLTSHEVRFGNPIAGQQEVCGHSYAGKNAEWQATEGVYLPVNMGRKSGDKAGSADEL